MFPPIGFTIAGSAALIGALAWATAPLWSNRLSQNETGTTPVVEPPRPNEPEGPTPEEIRSQRIRENPQAYILHRGFETLPETTRHRNNVNQAEAAAQIAQDELDSITAEMPRGVAPSSLYTTLLVVAVVLWILIAVAQAYLTGTIVFEVSNHNMPQTIAYAAGFLAVLEIAGIVIGVLTMKRQQGEIGIVPSRLGIVTAVALLVLVIAYLCSMASYRATLVYEDQLRQAEASIIEAEDIGDSYLLASAEQLKDQTQRHILTEASYYSVYEAAFGSGEAVLAYFVPSALQTRRYRQRVRAVAQAQAHHKQCVAALDEYEAAKTQAIANELYQNGADLSLLRQQAVTQDDPPPALDGGFDPNTTVENDRGEGGITDPIIDVDPVDSDPPINQHQNGGSGEGGTISQPIEEHPTDGDLQIVQYQSTAGYDL